MKAALVEVEDLCVDRGGMGVLDRVTFALHPGETLGGVGTRGAGKSTLAHSIHRVLHPCAGPSWYFACVACPFLPPCPAFSAPSTCVGRRSSAGPSPCSRGARSRSGEGGAPSCVLFFFKQKTAYEIGQ